MFVKEAEPAIGFRNYTPQELKALRQRLELSKEEVGHLIGVTGQTIYNVECGKNVAPAYAILYGLVLERYAAWLDGYIPAFLHEKVATRVPENLFADILKGFAI